MGRMQCDLCGSEDNVWHSVNGRCCEACEKGQTDMADEMKEIRQEIMEIIMLLDNATVFVQSHTLASYMLTAKKRLMVVHRKLKEQS